MSYCSHVLNDGSGCQCAPDLTEVVAELDRLRSALEAIVETRNTRHICKRHGGDGWAGDNDDECWCGISLDAEDKMREIASEALGSSSVSQGPENQT